MSKLFISSGVVTISCEYSNMKSKIFIVIALINGLTPKPHVNIVSHRNVIEFKHPKLSLSLQINIFI